MRSGFLRFTATAALTALPPHFATRRVTAATLPHCVPQRAHAAAMAGVSNQFAVWTANCTNVLAASGQRYGIDSDMVRWRSWMDGCYDGGRISVIFRRTWRFTGAPADATALRVCCRRRFTAATVATFCAPWFVISNRRQFYGHSDTSVRLRHQPLSGRHDTSGSMTLFWNHTHFCSPLRLSLRKQIAT